MPAGNILCSYGNALFSRFCLSQCWPEARGTDHWLESGSDQLWRVQCIVTNLPGAIHVRQDCKTGGILQGKAVLEGRNRQREQSSQAMLATTSGRQASSFEL